MLGVQIICISGIEAVLDLAGFVRSVTVFDFFQN